MTIFLATWLVGGGNISKYSSSCLNLPFCILIFPFILDSKSSDSPVSGVFVQSCVRGVHVYVWVKERTVSQLLHSQPEMQSNRGKNVSFPWEASRHNLINSTVCFFGFSLFYLLCSNSGSQSLAFILLDWLEFSAFVNPLATFPILLITTTCCHGQEYKSTKEYTLGWSQNLVLRSYFYLFLRNISSSTAGRHLKEEWTLTVDCTLQMTNYNNRMQQLKFNR